MSSAGQAIEPIDLYDEPGLVLRLNAYLTEKLGRPVEIGALKRFAVGFSWITYGFSIPAPGIEGVTGLILRLGPALGLFAPYSAAPQYLSLKALEGHDVPAPRAYYWSDDAAFLGAPFFISELVRGEAPIPWGPGSEMSDEFRHSLGAQFTDALGALHNIDWQRSGLAELAANVSVANAGLLQIEEWERNYHRWALKAYPMFDFALRWLRAHQPVAPRVSIVHGDYRLGNFLEVDGKITAILDWELVHLGDPHEDLAWFCLPQYRGGTKLMGKLIARDEFYARYEAKTGFAVSEESMRFYEIFNLVKLAATHMAGVYAFERKGFYDMRMPAMGTQIAPVLRQIEKALEANA